MKTLKDECFFDVNTHNFIAFEDIFLHVCAIPTYRVYRLYDRV